MTTITGAASSPAVIDAERGLQIYTQMLQIRAFEEKVNELYTRALMPGLAHLCIGQEAVAVGVCQALTSDDYITSTHRGHGHCLAKGAQADRMFAELLGKERGYCHGRGGSMHIADPGTGNLGANAIVGGSIALATGAAMSAKWLGTTRVAVCFFGEGALGQGVLYEAMNLSALWTLPVVYVCENNLYAEYTHVAEITAGDVLARPAAFGLRTARVDGQDARSVYAAALAAVSEARAGKGPAFIACDTYRYRGHHVGDVNRAYYRPKEEEHDWMTKRDPITRFGEWLIASGIAAAETLQHLDIRVRADIQSAAQSALDAPFPDPSEVLTHLYA